MNKTYEKVSKEAAETLHKYLATPEVIGILSKTKAATDGDAGTFKVIVSTDTKDRQGEIVNQEGWDLSAYTKNPVVLWAHKYDQLPIGMCTAIKTENGQLVAEGKFAPADANPFAQQVRKLYDLGMLNAVSVGFIPTEMDEKDQTKTSKQEMLEFSFVPVPANAEALRLSYDQVRTLNLDVAMLMTKGLKFDMSEKVKKEAQAGDHCELDDGGAGILAADPKNPDGPMVCVPSKAADKAPNTPGDDGDAIKAAHEAIKAFHKAVGAAHEDYSAAMKDFGDGDAADGQPTADSAKTAKAKGALSDEIAAIEQNEKKWQNMCQIFEAVDAMCSVYFDEATPVENFGGLATELSALIASVAGDATASKAAVVKMLGAHKALHFTLKDHMPAVKEAITCLDAAMKSHKNAQNLHKDTMEHTKNAYSALGGIKPAEGGESGDEGADGSKPEGNDAGGTKAAPQRSKTPEATDPDLNEFVETRELLRMFVTSGGAALERMNKKAREHAARK